MRASERAYQALRAEILDWSLPPGAGLGEVEQAERLGISRTPLREALSRLVADGLAEQAPGRGIIVADLSLEQADQLFDLRIALESLLARRAAQRATPEAAEHFTVLAGRFQEAEAALRGGTDPADYYAMTAELDSRLDEAAANPYLVPPCAPCACTWRACADWPPTTRPASRPPPRSTRTSPTPSARAPRTSRRRPRGSTCTTPSTI